MSDFFLLMMMWFDEIWQRNENLVVHSALSYTMVTIIIQMNLLRNSR
jgi:hypothetical protein